MSGMRLLNEDTYYWVWSNHGPADNGTYYGRTMTDGMIPCPIPGDSAQEMESFGYSIEEYEPGTWFSHWEKCDGSHHYRPIFAPIPQPFPPAEMPEEMPDEWAAVFRMYDKRGRLKKEHRRVKLSDALGVDGN